MRELTPAPTRLERRIDEVEADREAAEVRIHNDTEQMLDGLLKEVRTIADRISKHPAPAGRPRPGRPGRQPWPGPPRRRARPPPGATGAGRPARPSPASQQSPPVGRIGPPLQAARPPGRLSPARRRRILRGAVYSVEMLGSAWTLCGTTIRKFSGALAASSRIRTASSPWSVALSSSA